MRKNARKTVPTKHSFIFRRFIPRKTVRDGEKSRNASSEKRGILFIHGQTQYYYYALFLRKSQPFARIVYILRISGGQRSSVRRSITCDA